MTFEGICIITDNVIELTKFYSQILGVEAEGNEVHAELKVKGASLAIFSKEGMEGMAPNSMERAGFGNFTVSFFVDDVDAEYERIKKMEVEFVMLPTSHPWGRRSFLFRDADGNIVTFAGNIK